MKALWLSLLVVSILLLAGCTRSPEGSKPAKGGVGANETQLAAQVQALVWLQNHLPPQNRSDFAIIGTPKPIDTPACPGCKTFSFSIALPNISAAGTPAVPAVYRAEVSVRGGEVVYATLINASNPSSPIVMVDERVINVTPGNDSGRAPPLPADRLPKTAGRTAQQTAYSWLTTRAPTFLFDGMGDTVQLAGNGTHLEPAMGRPCRAGEECGQVCYPRACWTFAYNFSSRQGGYGNRAGQMLTQVITPHSTELWVDDAKGVVHAATDGRYDELTGQIILSPQEQCEKNGGKWMGDYCDAGRGGGVNSRTGGFGGFGTSSAGAGSPNPAATASSGAGGRKSDDVAVEGAGGTAEARNGSLTPGQTAEADFISRSECEALGGRIMGICPQCQIGSICPSMPCKIVCGGTPGWSCPAGMACGNSSADRGLRG